MANQKVKIMRLSNSVPGYKVNSRYGPRKSFKVGNVWTLPYHYGDDQSAPAGTPILAGLSGTVIRAGEDNNHDYESLGIPRWPGLKKGLRYGGGYWVFVQSGPLVVRYMHMQKWPSVKVGQKVTPTTVLGYIGKTGVATGNHLHKETLVNGKHVDPQSDLPTEGTAVKHSLFQNREKNRKIKPGQSLYLVDKNGKKLDINPDVGLNQTIVHVKVSGLTPGDTIWAVLEWHKPGVAGKAGVQHAVPAQTSPHFPETAVADNEGDAVFNVPFVRAVSLGWFVHLRVVASPKNKKTGNVHWIDADVIHFS